MPGEGQLDRAGDRWTLTFTRHLHHPPEKVWRAITEAEHISAWFPADIVGERVAGSPLQFVFREDEGPTLDGEVIAFDPPSTFEFRWADEHLRFDLTPASGGTTLRFINTFDDVGKAARDAAGWHVCLDVLEALLAGQDRTASPQDRWQEVHPRYVELFPAAASTIGPPTGG